MRVLIIRLSSMGDLVHALPALTDAATAHPEIHFDWVVDETFSDVPSWHQAVDRIIQCPPRRSRSAFYQSLKNGKFLSFFKQIRQTTYDLIIDLQGDFKGALTTYLSSGRSCGYDAKSVREWGAHFAYDQKYPVAQGAHSIERMRQLMAQALSYPYRNTPPRYGIDRSRLPTIKLKLPTPYLVFIHSTSWKSKCWPIAYWKQLSGIAIASGFSVVLPWGNKKEHETSTQIADGRDPVFVLPDLSISQKASVISNATATVGCDTGLSHISAGLSIPSVAIYGATDPALCGTIGTHQSVLVSQFECVKCHHATCRYEKEALYSPACLVEITPEKVWKKLQEVLRTAAYH
jgi:heptosyltransferase-1